MNLPELAQALTVTLAPALPYLVQVGTTTAEHAVQEVGAEAWAKAKALWARLAGPVAEKPAASEAVEDVAAAPEGAGPRAALTWQLEKILEAHPELAGEVARLLGGEAGVRVAVTGSGAVAVGQGAVAAGEGGIAVGGDVRGNLSAGSAHKPHRRGARPDGEGDR